LRKQAYAGCQGNVKGPVWEHKCLRDVRECKKGSVSDDRCIQGTGSRQVRKAVWSHVGSRASLRKHVNVGSQKYVKGVVSDDRCNEEGGSRQVGKAVQNQQFYINCIQNSIIYLHLN
jgi:hypothetical protein